MRSCSVVTKMAYKSLKHAVLISFCVILSAATTHGASFTYGNLQKDVRAGVLVVPGQSAISNPYAFYVIDGR